jgi:hypothetical protein
MRKGHGIFSISTWCGAGIAKVRKFEFFDQRRAMMTPVPARHDTMPDGRLPIGSSFIPMITLASPVKPIAFTSSGA